MRSPFQYFKGNSFLLFFVLETICLFLVVGYNKSQKEIFINSTNIFTGKIHEKTSEFSNYISLSALADKLSVQNAELRKQLIELETRMHQDSNFVIDSFVELDSTKIYEFLPVKIINNSVNKIYNTFTINKGKKDGIQYKQGVIGNNGVYGIVIRIGNHYSVAMSILNPEMKVSGMIQGRNYIGSINWDGDVTHVKMNDVPKHAIFEKGDTIITSGYSSIFPKGLHVGVIDTFWIESGRNFYVIDVKLGEDLSKMTYAYVVNHKSKEEQLSIEAGENE